MIRTNLATHPENERPGIRNPLALGVAAAVIATVANCAGALYYLRSDTQLRAQAARDEAGAADAKRAAVSLRAAVAAGDTAAIAADRDHARRLIARRMFSWTELLNGFETTLPPGVRLTSVRPGVTAGDRIRIEVSVVARSVEELDRFLRDLEGTAAFAGVLSRDERTNEGRIEALIEATYGPAAPPTAARVAP